jgi:hypothetical protein
VPSCQLADRSFNAAARKPMASSPSTLIPQSRPSAPPPSTPPTNITAVSANYNNTTANLGIDNSGSLRVGKGPINRLPTVPPPVKTPIPEPPTFPAHLVIPDGQYSNAQSSAARYVPIRWPKHGESVTVMTTTAATAGGTHIRP